MATPPESWSCNHISAPVGPTAATLAVAAATLSITPPMLAVAAATLAITAAKWSPE